MNGRQIDEHCTTAKGGPVGQTDAAAIKEKEKPIHDSADETLIHLTKGLLRMRKKAVEFKLKAPIVTKIKIS